MPQYYSIPNWRDRGKVTITPKSIWRRLPIFGKIIPYYVGNRVEFVIHIEKPQDMLKVNFLGPPVVWEKFGDKSKAIQNVIKTSTPVNGNPISSEGNIEYYLDWDVPNSGEETATIFTAYAKNKDTIFIQWFFLIIGVILGSVGTYLLNILNLLR